MARAARRTSVEVWRAWRWCQRSGARNLARDLHAACAAAPPFRAKSAAAKERERDQFRPSGLIRNFAAYLRRLAAPRGVAPVRRPIQVAWNPRALQGAPNHLTSAADFRINPLEPRATKAEPRHPARARRRGPTSGPRRTLRLRRRPRGRARPGFGRRESGRTGPAGRRAWTAALENGGARSSICAAGRAPRTARLVQTGRGARPSPLEARSAARDAERGLGASRFGLELRDQRDRPDSIALIRSRAESITSGFEQRTSQRLGRQLRRRKRDSRAAGASRGPAHRRRQRGESRLCSVQRWRGRRDSNPQPPA